MVILMLIVMVMIMIAVTYEAYILTSFPVSKFTFITMSTSTLYKVKTNIYTVFGCHGYGYGYSYSYGHDYDYNYGYD